MGKKYKNLSKMNLNSQIDQNKDFPEFSMNTCQVI